MTIAIGALGGILGMKAETTFGTKATSITKCMRLISDSVKPVENFIHSGAIPGLYTDDDEFELGRIRVGGSLGFEFRYEGFEMVLEHAMGSAGTVTITTGSNDKINFNIGAAELTATITAGAYKIGQTNSDSGTLCAAIHTAIVAAEAAGTYTVTYSITTRKFTITRSAGTLQLLWNTGTNTATTIGRTIGYSTSADDTGAITYTSDIGFTVSTEVATFIVSSANNKLNFNIGAAELTATIASATYAVGMNQNTTGSLCKAVYDAIVAAEAVGVYDVQFDIYTKKFTIKRSTGTFEILWKTGTNGSDGTDTHIGTLIGYSDAANDTGAVTYTADSVVVVVFDHSFTISDSLPIGLTFEIDRDQKAFTVEGGKINTLGISLEANGILKGTIGILGEDMTSGSATTFTLPTAGHVLFHHAAFVLNTPATEIIKNFSLNLDNKLKGDMDYVGSRRIAQPLRSGKYEVTGSFVMDFEDATEYDIFRAGTTNDLSLTLTSTTTIKSGYYYTITISLAKIRYTDGCPVIDSPGPLTVELPFKAYATDSTTREFTITVRNSLVAVD